MKKFWLYLFSIIVFVTSCNDKENIKIEWVILCDISDIAISKTPIRIRFINNQRKTEYFRLKINKTQKINISNEMELYSIGGPGGVQIYVFPDLQYEYIHNFKPNEIFSKTKAMEIFIYEPRIIESTENSITIYKHEDVLLYQYVFYKDNFKYHFYSKDNYIVLNTDFIREVNCVEIKDVKIILDIMKQEELDLCFFSQPISTYIVDGFVFQSNTANYNIGYFVKSKISDGDIVFLPMNASF